MESERTRMRGRSAQHRARTSFMADICGQFWPPVWRDETPNGI